MELCRETLELNPLLGEPYIIGGLALVKMERYDEAVEAALEARGLMPDSLEGLANLGYVYGAAGKRDRLSKCSRSCTSCLNIDTCPIT